jgi:two-component system phosphate regulon sensor histidine kinase PhoR
VSFYFFSEKKSQESYQALFLVIGTLIPTYAFFNYLILKHSQSLNVILAKAIQLETLLPIHQKFKTIYAKDEWSKIEVMMNNAELELKRQVEHIRDEHEKNKILLESIKDGIIAIDFFDNVLFSNKTFNSLFKFDQAKLFENFKIWKLFDDKTIVDAFHQCLKQTGAQELKAHKVQTARGELFFDIYLTPISNNHDEIIGVMGLFHDVSELKRLDQMRVDFVANVSHEIRTPLTAIRGFAQMLMQKENGNTQFLNRIIENSDHMLALFNDLLQLSVIESKEQIVKEQIEIKPLISHICSTHEQKYPKKKITWDYQFLTQYIFADARLIEQVLNNIIDNAIKYHHQNDVRISIKINEQHNQTQMTISDNGQGIEEKHLSRIFERFYRIDDARTKSNEYSGSGIGLSLVKHIVQKHSGKIEVKSVIGDGVEFKIYLPISD